MNISFLDFWSGFIPNNNFFYYLFLLIDSKIQVTRPEDADIIIFSCFGEYNKLFINKKRIFYTGENIRPDYNDIDLAFSFDFTDNDKNIRIPLWLLQIDWFNKINFTNPNFMIPYNEIDNNIYSRKDKNKFCSFVFNNPTPNRIEILNELSKYKKIDCYGKDYGNWFYGEDRKLNIISDYKFNICFENSIYPGYYTEKPIHAKVAGCIPLYWSDNNMSIDFNENAFINLINFNNIKEFVEYIIEIDNDNLKYSQIKSEKLFKIEQDPKFLLLKIIEKIQYKLCLK